MKTKNDLEFFNQLNKAECTENRPGFTRKFYQRLAEQIIYRGAYSYDELNFYKANPDWSYRINVRSSFLIPALCNVELNNKTRIKRFFKIIDQVGNSEDLAFSLIDLLQRTNDEALKQKIERRFQKTYQLDPKFQFKLLEKLSETPELLTFLNYEDKVKYFDFNSDFGSYEKIIKQLDFSKHDNIACHIIRNLRFDIPINQILLYISTRTTADNDELALTAINNYLISRKKVPLSETTIDVLINSDNISLPTINEIVEKVRDEAREYYVLLHLFLNLPYSEKRKKVLLELEEAGPHQHYHKHQLDFCMDAINLNFQKLPPHLKKDWGGKEIDLPKEPDYVEITLALLFLNKLPEHTFRFCNDEKLISILEVLIALKKHAAFTILVDKTLSYILNALDDCSPEIIIYLHDNQPELLPILLKNLSKVPQNLETNMQYFCRTEAREYHELLLPLIANLMLRDPLKSQQKIVDTLADSGFQGSSCLHPDLQKLLKKEYEDRKWEKEFFENF